MLVLITNRKSHMGFRLVPTSVTLNDLERRNTHYSTYFALLRVFDRKSITSQWLKTDLRFGAVILAKTDPRSSRTVSSTAKLLVTL